MLMGEPLFPGDSDIDQLYHIMVCLGNLIPRHQELFYKNPVFAGVRLPEIKETVPLERRYPRLSEVVIDLAKKCLHIDPDKRPFCAELLHHDFFHMDGFAERGGMRKTGAQEGDLSEILLLLTGTSWEKVIFPSPQIINDTNADPQIKDSKVFKTKGPKTDGEKVEKASRASNASCLNDNGMSPVKIVPSTSLRDGSNGSMDQTRNPGMAIPPLTHNLSATAPTVTSGMGTISGIQSY
ncbi:CDKL2, partial [Cervus elaphus hippelaphus]